MAFRVNRRRRLQAMQATWRFGTKRVRTIEAMPLLTKVVSCSQGRPVFFHIPKQNSR